MDPRGFGAHAALARLILKRFDEIQTTAVNPMPLNQIRDAAMRSKFKSRVDLDNWLVDGVGPHYRYLDEALFHTRRALALGPLHGNACLFLAELCFLENALPETKDAYVQQALDISPYDGDVLIAAGREAALAFDRERVVYYWKRAFEGSPSHRELLITTAAGAGIRAAEFMEIFKPRWPEIGLVYKTYARISTPEEVRELREAYLALAETEVPKLPRTEAGNALFEMYQIFKETGLIDRARDCLSRAVEANPVNLAYRHSYAIELRDAGDYVEAEKQLNWCLQRVPSNLAIKQDLTEVVKLRIGDSTRSASAPVRVFNNV